MHDLILNTKTSKITTLKKGFYEIKGKVVGLEDGLISPMSEVPCVYYDFIVEQERSSGKSRSYHKIIDDERYVKFAVEDSTGKAIIYMRGASMKFYNDVKTKSDFWNKATDEMDRALGKYGNTSDGWVFEKTLRYKETFLEEGDEVYILGEVVDFEGYYPVFRVGKLPYIISDKSEETLLKSYKIWYRFALFFLFAAAFGSVYFVLDLLGF